MTFAEITSAIRGRFAELARDELDLPTVYDNAPEPEKAAQWCRFKVNIDSRTQVSTGGPTSARFRTRGTVTAEVYASHAQGDGALWDLADSICGHFEAVRLSDPDIRFFSPSPVGVAQRTDSWFRREVRFQFESDNIGAGT